MKKQSNRRILSHSNGFGRDVIFGKATSEKQENIKVNEGTTDRDFTVGTFSRDTVIKEIVVNVRTLERRFNERIDGEFSNIVDTVQDRIQNGILTCIENKFGPKIEIVIRSINKCSGQCCNKFRT